VKRSKKPRTIRLACAAFGLVLAASCASGPEKAPPPAAAPNGAPAAAAGPSGRASASPGAAKEARSAQSAPLPVEMDDYFKASFSDYRRKTLSNGASVAVKRQSGRRNAVARIALARDADEDAPRSGYAALAMAAAARSVPAKGFSAGLARDEWEQVALEISCPPERMDEVLGLVAKALAAPSFTAKDFDAALGEARVAERREAGDPFARARAELRSARYRADPRGLPPWGTTASLAAATREDVMRYWAELFSAERVSVAVVGDFDPATFIGAIESAFGSLPRGKSSTGVAARASAPVVPWFKALAASSTPAQALLRGEYSSPEASSPDYPAMIVALAALDDLVLDALRGTRTGISSSATPETSVSLFGSADPAAMKSAVDGAAAELAGGRCLDPGSPDGKHAALGASLEAYKARAIASFYAGAASSEGMAARIACDMVSGGDGAAMFRMSSRIGAVRAEDVPRVARRYLLEGSSAWVALGDPALVLGLSPESFASRGGQAPKP
jgi:zinc protease